MLSFKSECGYCQTLGPHLKAGVVFNRALYFKYCESQNYFYVKNIDAFLGNKAQKKLLDLKELIKLNQEKEYLIAYFPIMQYKSKIVSISNYYRFVIEIPRFLLDRFGRMITMYHDAKRQLLYSKLKKKFGQNKEKTVNPLKSNYLITEENDEIKNKILESDLFKKGTSHYNISNTLEGLIGILPEVKNQSNLDFSKMIEVPTNFPKNHEAVEKFIEQKIPKTNFSKEKIASKVNFFKKFFNAKNSNQKSSLKNLKAKTNATINSPKSNNFTQISQNSQSKICVSPVLDQRKTFYFKEDKHPPKSPKNSIYTKIMSRKKSTPHLGAEIEKETSKRELLSRKFSEQSEISSTNKAELKQSKVISALKYSKLFPRNASLQSIFQKVQSFNKKANLKTEAQHQEKEKIEKSLNQLKNFRVKTQASGSFETKGAFSQGLQGDVVLNNKISNAISKKILSQKK